MAVRDRIKELRRVRAGDLIANPRNWRTHPEDQRNALTAMLDEVGWADALIARETPEGLELVDGHLRAGIDPDATVPVLVVDLDDEEAGKVLLTMDPIAAMAEADRAALKELMESVMLPDESALARLTEKLASEHFTFDLPTDSLVAGAIAAKPSESDAAIEAPVTGVRVVQLFLDEATHKEFVAMEGRLRGVLGTTNASDTVIVLLRNAIREVEA